MSLTTARAIVDGARIRHWAFSSLTLGDGAALLFLRTRLVAHVATHGAAIEGLVNTTVQYAVPLAPATQLVTTSGTLFATTYALQFTTNTGNTGLGTLRLAAPYEDGWPIHVSAGGVPYVDFSEAPIATDPFGTQGGVPGFPLPIDVVRVTAVSLVITGNRVVPCEVIPESQRHTTLPGRDLAVFVNAGRLVPVQPLASGNTGTRWNDVTAIQLTYVGLQTLRALDDTLNLPSVLTEALVADCAAFLAAQCKDMDLREKQMFAAEAARAGAAIANAGLELLAEPTSTSVHYRG